MEKGNRDDKDISVVIGRDHRHGSEEFAKVTAATFASRGFKIYQFNKIVPTPYLSYAVKILKADFGVMITASHNPKEDNGYKVYGQNSSQINSPTDKEIASLIQTKNRHLWDISPDYDCEDPWELVHSSYLRSTLDSFKNSSIKFGPKIVYTPMHGVGYEYVKELIIMSGLPELIVVKEQQFPDPEFPTVKFPNPEEGGDSLRSAFSTANQVLAPVVFANDPDADRFNFAERTNDDQWYIFNGNEIALLLAEYLLRNSKEKPERIAFVASKVSSNALGWLAEKAGVKFYQADTGFKNLAAKAVQLTAEGYKVLLTYEEAIGYMVGNNVWDKDGISALLCAYHMTFEVYSRGLTLKSHLDYLMQAYGYLVQYNSYYFTGSKKSKAVYKELVTKLTNLATPTVIGMYHLEFRDLSSGLAYLSFTNGVWIAFRASGTEPKLKFYSECRAETNDFVKVRQQELYQQVTFICDHFLSPSENGLVLKIN